MTSNDLKERVMLTEPIYSESKTGSGKPTYREVQEVWAAWRPLKSYEIARFHKMERAAEVEVTIRARADVQSDWRLLHQGCEYRISDINKAETEWLTLVVVKHG